MPLENTQSLWDFSVRVYGHEPVKACCLSLQDSANIDVCVLLTVAWLGYRGHSLTDTELQSLLAVASPWQQQLVQPVRALRKTLGQLQDPSKQNQADGLLRLDINAVYTQAKALELDTERRQLMQLQQWLESGLLQSSAINTDRTGNNCIDANTQLYLSGFTDLTTDTISKTTALLSEYVN